jgi:hypothetical protein
MSWLKRTPEKSRRERLIEARDALRRQIDVLDAGPIKPYAGERRQFRSQAAGLREMLQNIEAQLAELGSSDG